MKRNGIAWLFGLLLLVAGGRPALAVEPEEQLANPALEARARGISRELRCVVCQSQTIDDSSAPVAAALRKLVRDRLIAGDTDQQVIASVTQRYGEFVLLKPRLSGATFVLWVGPFVVLALGGAVAVHFVRQHDSEDRPPPLTAEEEKVLAEALERPEDRAAT